MKTDPPDKYGGFLCKAIYAGTRCVNKLGDKRADCFAAGGSGDITVGE